jgi:hypothetical protein
MYVEMDLDFAADPVEVLSVRIAGGDGTHAPMWWQAAQVIAGAVAARAPAGRPYEPRGAGLCPVHSGPPAPSGEVTSGRYRRAASGAAAGATGRPPRRVGRRRRTNGIPRRGGWG